MIRFCDKEVYNIVEGDFTRSQLLIFFLEEKTRKFSVIAIFRKDGTFKGIITYRDLIEFEELEKSINPDKIEVSDSFWADARTYFGRSCRKLLTVVDRNENILGFVYNDSHYRYNTLFNMLSAMEKTVLVLPERYQKIKIIIITDLNELAWKCYKIFVKNGFDICVVGEKWEWFGLKSGENYNYYPDFWKFYIYAEGTKCLREENEWGQSCYDDVFDNFLFIYEMGVANSIDIYDKQIRRLLKDGVAICECSIPMNDEIMNKTLYEEFSIACNMDLSDYLEKRKKYTNVQKRCLWNLYGYENIITYRKFGNEREVELVTFRSIYGRTLKGIEFVKRIYLLGPCIVRGYGCLESDSLVAQLQKNVMKFEYQVIAVAIPNGRFDLWRECLKYLPVREKDIILCVNYSDFFGGSVRKCNYIDLKPIYEEKDRESIFCGEPLHTNGKGNQLIAKEIMSRFLTDKIIEMKTKYSNRFLQKGEILNEDVIKSIEYYVNCIKINKGGGGKEKNWCNCDELQSVYKWTSLSNTKCS